MSKPPTTKPRASARTSGVEVFKQELARAAGPQGPLEDKHKVTTVTAVAASKKLAKSNKRDELRKMEDELLNASLDRVQHAMNFAQVSFKEIEQDEDGEDIVPNEIREKYGERATEVHRLMKCGQLPNSQAPIGLILATKMATSIIKARATEKSAPKSLSIAVQIVSTAPTFEVIEVDS